MADVDTIIPDDLIKFIEKAGFLVSDSDDFYRIEIKDPKNNNELLSRFFCDSNNFNGINGKKVSLWLNSVRISLAEGVNIIKTNSKYVNKYEIEVIVDKNHWCTITFNCILKDDKNIESVFVEMGTCKCKQAKQNLQIIQMPFSAIVYHNRDFCSTIDIEKCDSKLYLEIILGFLNQDKFVSKSLQIQECLKIVLPFFGKDIDNMLSTFSINDNSDIKKMNFQVEND